jgi:hypothetical protein
VPTYDQQAGGRLELRAVRIVGGHGVFRNMVTNETIADGTEANYPPGTLVSMRQEVDYVTMFSTLQPCCHCLHCFERKAVMFSRA